MPALQEPSGSFLDWKRLRAIEGRVLVVAHRREIFNQAYVAFKNGVKEAELVSKWGRNPLVHETKSLLLAWVSTPDPKLCGRTPLAVLGIPEGRLAVEELLFQIGEGCLRKFNSET